MGFKGKLKDYIAAPIRTLPSWWSHGADALTRGAALVASFPHIGGNGFHVLAFTELERDKVTPSSRVWLAALPAGAPGLP